MRVVVMHSQRALYLTCAATVPHATRRTEVTSPSMLASALRCPGGLSRAPARTALGRGFAVVRFAAARRGPLDLRTRRVANPQGHQRFMDCSCAATVVHETPLLCVARTAGRAASCGAIAACVVAGVRVVCGDVNVRPIRVVMRCAPIRVACGTVVTRVAACGAVCGGVIVQSMRISSVA